MLKRALLAGGLALVAFLYYRPLQTYMHTKQVLDRRSAEVQVLQAQKGLLERRLARSSSSDSLIRQARALALVRPGERLFIVKGIPDWRRAHAPK
jgi:hypothetical protein